MAKSIAGSDIKPVYALVGPDAFLQTHELSDVLATVTAARGEVQRVDVDGERAELSGVLDELRSFAMFGGAKLVVVRSADAFLTRHREAMEDYVARPAESGVLVLRFDSLPANQRIYKAIAKTGEIRRCEPPADRTVPAWIASRGKDRHGVTLTREAADLLFELVGNDLGRLDNELAKLAIGGSNIGAAEVAGGVAFQREQELREMTRELGAGRTAEAVRRWRQLVSADPSSEFRAVTWLGMWLEQCRKALAMRAKGMPAASMGNALWIRDPKELSAFVANAEAIGTAGLARALDLLVDVDRQCKTAVGTPADNVERFIVSVIPPARAPR